MRTAKKDRVQINYDKDMKKLLPYGVKVDAQGRYLVYLDETNDLPKAYFADKTGARIRIFTTTYHRWLEEGKAVAVSDEELPRRRKKKAVESEA